MGCTFSSSTALQCQLTARTCRGKSLALALANAGADIVLVQAGSSPPSSGCELTLQHIQRNKENLETYDAITAIGRRVSIAVCDLANDDEVKGLTKLVTGSKEEGGMGDTIDILVNCGGIQRRWVECARERGDPS